tara:strand:+ start:14734 stop:15522 length:789 start_codon:yes stop_codon:yes gene_type:complete
MEDNQTAEDMLRFQRTQQQPEEDAMGRYADGIEENDPFLHQKEDRTTYDLDRLNPHSAIGKAALGIDRTLPSGNKEYNTGDLDLNNPFAQTMERTTLDDKKLAPQDDKGYKNHTYDQNEYGQKYSPTGPAYGENDETTATVYPIESTDLFKQLRQGTESKEIYEPQDPLSQNDSAYNPLSSDYGDIAPSYDPQPTGYHEQPAGTDVDLPLEYRVVGGPESHVYHTPSPYDSTDYQPPSDLEQGLRRDYTPTGEFIDDFVRAA